MTNLTKKEKGFVKDYVETGNGVQSALENYDTDDYNTAGVIAHENLKKPKIINAIKSIAEQIPDDLIVRKHLALLNKEEVITKNNMTTGEIDVIPTGQIDVQAVKAGLDMTYKLKGLYAPEKSINLEVTAHVTDPKLKEINEEYNRKVFEALKDNG